MQVSCCILAPGCGPPLVLNLGIKPWDANPYTVSTNAIAGSFLGHTTLQLLLLPPSVETALSAFPAAPWVMPMDPAEDAALFLPPLHRCLLYLNQ